MMSLRSPAFLLKSLLKTRHQTVVRGNPRRKGSKQQSAARAMVEALEPRTMLSGATHLGFTVQPSGTVAGESLSNVTVSVLDAGDSVVTSSSALVTFNLASG